MKDIYWLIYKKINILTQKCLLVCGRYAITPLMRCGCLSAVCITCTCMSASGQQMYPRYICKNRKSSETELKCHHKLTSDTFRLTFDILKSCIQAYSMICIRPTYAEVYAKAKSGCQAHLYIHNDIRSHATRIC